MVELCNSQDWIDRYTNALVGKTDFKCVFYLCIWRLSWSSGLMVHTMCDLLYHEMTNILKTTIASNMFRLTLSVCVIQFCVTFSEYFVFSGGNISSRDVCIISLMSWICCILYVCVGIHAWCECKCHHFLGGWGRMSCCGVKGCNRIACPDEELRPPYISIVTVRGPVTAKMVGERTLDSQSYGLRGSSVYIVSGESCVLSFLQVL